MDRLRIPIERGTEAGNRRGEQNHCDDRRRQRQLPHVDSHRNTSSSPTPNARAIRNASSSDGAYRPASNAMIVCRVTPQACASASWVISPCSKRKRRLSLTIGVPLIGTCLRPPPPPAHPPTPLPPIHP